VRQVEPIAKHPVVRAIPFAKVDVPVPVTARKVVVAWVVVLLMPVKFCRVVEPSARRLMNCPVPPIAVAKVRFVVDALVAKRFVDVALVVVPVVTVSEEMVVDAYAVKPPLN